MPSILNNTFSMRLQRHVCGGEILVGGSGENEHRYCVKCGAYRYTEVDGGLRPLPSGTDPEANKAAWDAGYLESPDSI